MGDIRCMRCGKDLPPGGVCDCAELTHPEIEERLEELAARINALENRKVLA